MSASSSMDSHASKMLRIADAQKLYPPWASWKGNGPNPPSYVWQAWTNSTTPRVSSGVSIPYSDAIEIAQ